MRIKVVQGKGNKDRYTLLSSFTLTTLREYFRKHRHSVYLFEGKQKGKGMHTRRRLLILRKKSLNKQRYFVP